MMTHHVGAVRGHFSAARFHSLENSHIRDACCDICYTNDLMHSIDHYQQYLP